MRTARRTEVRRAGRPVGDVNRRRDVHGIDEFIISVVPIFIGDGIPLIARRHRQVPLLLESTEKFEDGLVQLRYTVLV